MKKLSRSHLSSLHRILADRFDEEELRTLCFDLGIKYGDLPSKGLSNKARDLVDYFHRRRIVSTLLTKARESRPDVNWDEFEGILLDAPDGGRVSYPSEQKSFAKIAFIGFGFLTLLLLIGGLIWKRIEVSFTPAVAPTTTETPSVTPIPPPTSTALLTATQDEPSTRMGSPTPLTPSPSLSDTMTLTSPQTSEVIELRYSDGMPMVYVSAGSFEVGSDRFGSSEAPAHQVELSRDYWAWFRLD